MSKFFDETMQGLLEAVAIEKGGVTLKEIENMPAPTFVAVEKEKELIDQVVCIRKAQKLSQSKLAHMTGNNQQAISRMENKEHSPSLKLFCNAVNALGYEVKLIKKGNA